MKYIDEYRNQKLARSVEEKSKKLQQMRNRPA